jgi:hypothetical protein
LRNSCATDRPDPAISPAALASPCRSQVEAQHAVVHPTRREACTPVSFQNKLVPSLLAVPTAGVNVCVHVNYVDAVSSHASSGIITAERAPGTDAAVASHELVRMIARHIRICRLILGVPFSLYEAPEVPPFAPFFGFFVSHLGLAGVLENRIEAP